MVHPAFAATVAQEEQTNDVVFPPSDLLSDEPPLETDLHRRQMELLIASLEAHWRDQQDFYASGNLTIYYSMRQLKSEDFRGPDFFVVLGTERRNRKSWTVWTEQGKYPNVIVEILSETTAAVDRGLKKQIYQDVFRTPDYFWFDPFTLEFQGFHLGNAHYQAIAPTRQGWLWSQQLGLYLGVHARQLRFFESNGTLVPTGEEQEYQRAEAERQRAETAQQAAEAERQRAETAQQAAEAERQRAEQAEQAAERLRAQLRASVLIRTNWSSESCVLEPEVRSQNTGYGIHSTEHKIARHRDSHASIALPPPNSHLLTPIS